MQGASGYDSWYIDSESNHLRLYTISANTDTVQIFNAGAGVAELTVENDLYAFDVWASRGDSTGVIYFGGLSTRYLYWNNSTYNLPGASVVVNGTTYTSDQRLKEDIRPIANDQTAMGLLNKLEPKRFHWKPNTQQAESIKGDDFGMLAQDVRKVLPEIVTEVDMTSPTQADGKKAEPKTLNEKLGKVLTVDYQRLVPWLLAGLQEVAKQLKELEVQVKALLAFETEINKLEAENKTLRARAEKLKAESNDLRLRAEKLEKILMK